MGQIIIVSSTLLRNSKKKTSVRACVSRLGHIVLVFQDLGTYGFHVGKLSFHNNLKKH